MAGIVVARYPAEREFPIIPVTAIPETNRATRREVLTFAAALAAITAVLLVYSQTIAFGWDEGFHLLAARLIAAGKRPYEDFLFAQTPLNAYWNSLLMRVFGLGWRAPHAAAALETVGAVWLIADYVWRNAPAYSRVALAVTVAVLLGVNDQEVWYATIGQAYGMCMLLSALAFRFGIAAVEGPWWMASLAGVAAGAAASSSLLTVTLGPVLFVWLAIRTRGRRVPAFILGAAVGLAPVLWYLIQAPRQFVFDVIEFHVHFRHIDWGDWIGHDIGTLTGWVDSGFGLIIVTLAVAGTIIGRKRRDIVLAAWLSGAACIYLATTHPTFPQYFTVMTPFAVVLASVAIQELYGRYRYLWPLIAMGAITIAGLGRDLWETRADMTWGNIDRIAKAVKEAQPDPKPLFADEHVYLMTGIMPPPGMQWGSGHKVEIPLDQARTYHVLPQSELDREVKHGDYGTLETCEDSDIKRMDLEKIYPHKQEIGDCYVFSRR